MNRIPLGNDWWLETRQQACYTILLIIHCSADVQMVKWGKLRCQDCKYMAEEDTYRRAIFFATRMKKSLAWRMELPE